MQWVFQKFSFTTSDVLPYRLHKEKKLISSFFKEEIELIISKIKTLLFKSVIFHGIFWSDNSLVLGSSLGIEQSKISYFQALSTLI